MDLPIVDIESEFESRRQHAWNKLRYDLPKDVRMGRFLDIGCGIGNGLVAALQLGFETAVGIDRNFNEFPWFHPDNFDNICRFNNVDPSNAIMIEGDLFRSKFIPKSFDCVFMLDSIEHVADPKGFIKEAISYLAPGGALILDTCPLYYSTQGGHLFNDLSPEVYPWVHLRNDFSDLVRRFKVGEWSMRHYHELNKITHQEIRDTISQSGLHIVYEERGKETEEDRALLEENRPHLNLTGIPEHLLFEDWIIVVGRRYE